MDPRRRPRPPPRRRPLGASLFLLGYAVVFTWIHHHTGASILAAVALHFSINLTFAVAAPFDGAIIAIATVVLAVRAGLLAWRDPSLGGANRTTGRESPIARPAPAPTDGQATPSDLHQE